MDKQPRVPRRDWTSLEVERLRALVRTMSVEDVAAQLGHSTSGVKAKAHNLGISIRVKRPPEVKYRRWTTEEEDQLERLLQAGESTEAIAVQLNRTPGAVKLHAYHLGLINSPARLRNQRSLIP